MLGRRIRAWYHAQKRGRNIARGGYKMRKKYCTSTTQPHNHTTTTHTTINISRCRPTLQRLRPSPSMGRPAAPPNHGAAAPYGPMHGSRHRLCSRRPSIPCFGASKCNPSKNREGDGALALGGRRLITANNNQPKVGVCGGGDIGEGARL